MSFISTNFLTILLAIFLIINLIIGLKAGKSNKTIEEYAVGTRNYTDGALIMTLLATALSGSSFFRGSERFAALGICTLAGGLGSLLSMPIWYFFMSRHIEKLRSCNSMGDVFERFFGINAKIFSGVLNGFVCLIVVGSEIQILSIIFENFLDIEGRLGIYISATLLALYTAFGGMKAVMATDILQFICIIIAVFFLSNITVNKAGGISQILSTIPEIKLEMFRADNMPYFIVGFILFFMFSALMFWPANFQRLIMARDEDQVKSLLLHLQLGNLAFVLSVGAITFAVISINPEIKNNIIIYAINNIIPSELKGIIIIGIIALVFSSGDSFLHSAGLSLYYDTYVPLFKKTIESLSPIKIFVFISGITSVIFAFHGVAFMRLDYVLGVSASTLFFPLTACLIGMVPSKKGFWYGAALGGFLFLVLRIGFLGKTLETYSTLIGAVVDMVVYLAIHAIENNGFAFTPDKPIHHADIEIEQIKKISFLKFLVDIWTFPQAFRIKCKEKLASFGAPYEIFGVFYILVIMMPYFIWASPATSVSLDITYFKMIGLVLCSLLVTRSLWSKNYEKYLAAFWFFTLTYCLPFLSCIMLVFSNGAIEYTINIAISIMLLIMLVDWLSAIVMAIVGVCFAVIIYNLGYSNFNFHFEPSTKYLLIYQIFFGGIIGLLFARRKDIYISATSYKKRYLEEINKDHATKIHQSESTKYTIYKDMGNGDVDILENFDKAIVLAKATKSVKLVEKLSHMRTYLKSMVDYATDYYRLSPVNMRISECEDILNNLFKDSLYKNVNIKNFSVKNSIHCDEIGLLRIMCQMVVEVQEKLIALEKPQNTKIKIHIFDTKIHYFLDKISSYSKQTEAIGFAIYIDENFYNEQKANMYKVQLINPENIIPIAMEDVDHVSALRTIDAHYGLYRNIDTENNLSIECILPVNVYSMRPETLDLELPVESLQVWPEADKAEHDLIEKIKKSAPEISIDLVNKAIYIIKKYHSHQERKSKEPYFIHPIIVTNLLLDIINDNSLPPQVYEFLKQNRGVALVASLLHDILEDTAYHPGKLLTQFGSQITEIVLTVTKIDYNRRPKMLSNIEAFTNLETKDLLSICIKLADRLHNIQTIDGHPNPEKRIKVAEETLKYFVNTAENLGFKKIASLLKNSSDYIIKNGKIAGFEW